mmetsp:Transcript_9059/g.22041  ORF Transcript_9059/g.22041 Transcript_9059/m.22041 type:complete len:212 (-) Transcript_9059:73-708(-)
MASLFTVIGKRAVLCTSKIPTTLFDWTIIVATSLVTSGIAGLFATLSGFVNPREDYHPPWERNNNNNNHGNNAHRRDKFHWSVKPLSAFLFPSFVEEVVWRGVLIGSPSTKGGGFSSQKCLLAGVVLVVHVLFHPVAGCTYWPRGRNVFVDWRFLVGATIVLSGATLSYVVSGGSAHAAALTHGLCVALWRDFFGGEAQLIGTAERNRKTR